MGINSFGKHTNKSTSIDRMMAEAVRIATEALFLLSDVETLNFVHRTILLNKRYLFIFSVVPYPKYKVLVEEQPEEIDESLLHSNSLESFRQKWIICHQFVPSLDANLIFRPPQST